MRKGNKSIADCDVIAASGITFLIWHFFVFVLFLRFLKYGISSLIQAMGLE